MRCSTGPTTAVASRQARRRGRIPAPPACPVAEHPACAINSITTGPTTVDSRPRGLARPWLHSERKFSPSPSPSADDHRQRAVRWGRYESAGIDRHRHVAASQQHATILPGKRTHCRSAFKTRGQSNLRSIMAQTGREGAGAPGWRGYPVPSVAPPVIASRATAVVLFACCKERLIAVSCGTRRRRRSAGQRAPPATVDRFPSS
jgi:hypothetical protein